MANLRALTMPKWGIEMSEGMIAEWMIEPGAAFAKGEVLTLIETDKITNEVEAEFEGSLARILVPAGETVPVGTLLAVLASGPIDASEIDQLIAQFVPADTQMASAGGAAMEIRPALQPVQTEVQAQAQPEAEAEPEVRAPERAVAIPSDLAISPAARQYAQYACVSATNLSGRGRGGRITLQDVMLTAHPRHFVPATAPVSVEALGQSLGHVYASPLAKRLAVLHGIDLSGVEGSGPRGRICKADVLQKVAPTTVAPEPAAPPAIKVQATNPGTFLPDGPFEAVPMSSMRKAIARQLSISKQTIPHFYLRFAAQLDAILHLRQLAKQATGSAPSVNDYLVRATAIALVEHPDINVQFTGEVIRRFAQANISIAVETPKGLMTPVVRDAQTKTVAQISSEIRQLADRARSGKIQPDDMHGGSFSISNLGMFGVESFDAIINPPQGAILAVGAGIRKPIDANHAVAFATMASLSLSFDHRVIDGAAGARFGQTLKALIEDPARLTA